MAINPLSFPMPQAFSGGADFSQLANLSNVYNEAQDRATRLQALGQLGSDPTQNAMLMIKSRDPQLAQQGIQLMNTIQQQNRLNAQEAERQREFQLNYQLNQQSHQLAQQKYEQDSPEARKQQLIDAGLDPDTPEGRAFRATGQNFPAPEKQTSVDRTAIRQADDQVFAARAGLQSLDHMETLRKQSIHAGPLTQPIGYAASFLPEGYGGTAGKATEELRYEALNQMIARVKASFGGNPSNREDAWLLEAQASSNKSSDVQKDIIDRGKEILQDRLKQNMDRANELRGGTFYKPGGGATAPPAPGGGSTALVPAAPASGGTGAAAGAMLPSADWMARARKANPGMSDSDLVANWKKKHPNG